MACLGCILKAALHSLHLFKGKNPADLYSRYGRRELHLHASSAFPIL